MTAPYTKGTSSYLYDGFGHVCGVDFRDGTIVLGYWFARRTQSLLAVGCIFNSWVYDNNIALVLLYSPELKEAEAWQGSWSNIKDGTRVIINPIHCGVISRKFENDAKIMEFLKSPTKFPYRFGYLYQPS